MSSHDSDAFEASELAYLKETPVETVLGNHIFVLVQLAALRLSLSPPDVAGAQLIIDTLSAIINAGGDRLGEHVGIYRNALAEVQQLYVRSALHPGKDSGS